VVRFMAYAYYVHDGLWLTNMVIDMCYDDFIVITVYVVTWFVDS